MRVFVTGGSGYVGQPIVDSLLRHGHEVVALQRPGSPRALQARPGLRTVEGDLLDIASLASALKDADAVIHLVGIIREHPSRGITMERIHVDGTRALVKAAQDAGVRRLIHMSALGARESATSAYHISKWKAEELVRNSGIPFTIFRPSVIFGQGGPGPNFMKQLRELVLRSPICPLIGDGQYFLQPVSIRTVAELFRLALDEPRSLHQAYEVGGPEILSYLEILRRISKSVHKRPMFVRIPRRWMEIMTAKLQRLPAFPITMDQLIMLKEGNVCSYPDAVYRDFSVAPIPFVVTL